MKRFQTLGSSLVFCLAVSVMGVATAAAADSLVIEGGTVHTMAGEAFVGRVVVAAGRIIAAGPEAAVPAGATRIDASGQHVWPGLFDALSQVGLVEIGAVAATDDEAEMGIYNPHLTAVSAIHPASQLIPVARANGITHTVVAPDVDGGGVVAGQAALVDLAGWTVEEMAIEPTIAMVLVWPETVTRSFSFASFSFVNTPFKKAREEVDKKVGELSDWFDAARHYAQAQSAGSARLEPDLKLAALARVVGGEQPLIVRADAKRDIEAALAFADEQGLSIVLAGGRDAWQLTDLLAEKDVPVILGFTHTLPNEEDDDYDRPFRTAGDLVAAGIKVAFASGAGGGGPHDSRTVPYEVAAATAFGLAPEDALKALTVWAAEIHGVGDRLGSIEPGKIANLIVSTGSPLEVTNRVEHLIIGGREVSTDNRHRQLYEAYRAR